MTALEEELGAVRSRKDEAQEHSTTATITMWKAGQGEWTVPPPADEKDKKMTNKATILLKIKDRKNEQSQTNPIRSLGNSRGPAA